MKKFLLRLALPILLEILEPALRDALRERIRIPDAQRKTLSKLGYSETMIAIADVKIALGEASANDKIVSEVLGALNKAVK